MTNSKVVSIYLGLGLSLYSIYRKAVTGGKSERCKLLTHYSLTTY